MICPKCNREVPIGSNICPSCGADLTRMRMSAENASPRANATQRRGGNARGTQQGTRRRPGTPQANPQALVVAIGLVIVFLVLLVLLFRAIFGGGDQTGPGGQPAAIDTPAPSPTFKIFGVDVNTPEPVPTRDPLADLQIEATPTPAAPTAEPTYETLRKGSKGEDVKRLQEALIAMGYLEDGGADGDYGNGTLAAVKEFQKDNGLSADGQAGQKTLSTLYRLYGGDIDTTSTTGGGTGSSNTTTNNSSPLILDQPG